MCYSQYASNFKPGCDYSDFKSEKVTQSNECAVLRCFDCIDPAVAATRLPLNE